MSKKLSVESDQEMLAIDKKTYKNLQSSLDNKHALYVASREREYEATQQKNKIMDTLKIVSNRCNELMIKNQRGKIDNADLDKKRLDGEELDKHLKNNYDKSESKKALDNELARILEGIKEIVIDKLNEQGQIKRK